jgi:hypothetical protein
MKITKIKVTRAKQYRIRDEASPSLRQIVVAQHLRRIKRIG